MYEVYKLHFYSRDLVQISLRQLIAVEVTTELPTRMATLFGHVGEFNDNKREWIQYVEQLDHFYEANGITENNWNNCYNRSRDLQDTKECCNAQKTRRDVIPRFRKIYSHHQSCWYILILLKNWLCCRTNLQMDLKSP